MADASDVADCLVGILSGLLYPNGTSLPSVAGANVRVYTGYPVPDQLDADLGNQLNGSPTPICNLSVYPLPVERNTTRYLQRWQPAFQNTPTLTLMASGQTVTVSGTIPPASNPHNAVVFVNGIPYVYAVQPNDTQAGIAAALAALMQAAGVSASSYGPTLTLPLLARLGPVRIGVTGLSVNTIASQEKQFQIGIWADSPQNRTLISKVIDPALKALTFLLLPDFTNARIRSFGSRDSDTVQKQGIYSRMLIYAVDYATTVQRTDTQVTQVQVNVTPSGATSPVVTIYD